MTPPVAVPAYAAAGIAHCSPAAAGWAAFRMAIPGFLVPYVLVLQPSILFVNATAATLIPTFLSATLGVMMLAFSIEGWVFQKANLVERVLLFGGGLLLIYPGTATDLIGLTVTGAIAVLQYLQKRKHSRTPVSGASSGDAPNP